MKKGFFRRNWDLFLAFLSLIIGVILTAIGMFGCNGWGCLDVVFYFLLGGAFFNLFIITSIIRTIRNKSLSRKRWFWIGIPIFLGLIGNIFYLVGNNAMFTVTLSVLSPITIIFLIKYLLLIFSSNSSLSIAGASQVSQITTQQFQNLIKDYHYVEIGIKQLIGVT